MAIAGLGFVFAALNAIQAGVCPACGKVLPPLAKRTRMLTCGDECRTTWIDRLVAAYGPTRRVTSTESGRTYEVPTRVILEHGIRHADLGKYPVITYVIHTVADRPAIECLLCGRVSELPGDVDNKYCGRCHLFHDVVAEGRAMVDAGGTHDCGEWLTYRGVCALCGRQL